MIPKEVKVGIYINKGGVNDFVNKILDGRKTIETRTYRGLRLIEKDVQLGDRIAIITDKRIVGYATVESFINYLTRDAFNRAYDYHLVHDMDSRYGWDDAKGKAGIRLRDVVRCEPLKVLRLSKRPVGHVKLSDCLFGDEYVALD